MGLRGPSPIPMKQLQARGSKLARHAKDNPDPAVEAPQPPDWLDDIARTEWFYIVGELVSLGVVARIDRAALAGYCNAYSSLVKADRDIQEHGETATTDKGYEYQRPAVGMRAEARTAMLKYLREFGLSPSSRRNVNAQEKPKADGGKSRFFKGG